MNANSRKVRARDIFEAFLLKYYSDELLKILQEENGENAYSLVVDFLLLFEEHFEVSEAVLISPLKLLTVFDKAFLKALLKKYDTDRDSVPGLSLKLKVHIRISGLPRCPELYRHAIPDTTDVGRILCICGTVVRTVSPKMLEYQREYICLKCKHVFEVSADYSMYYYVIKPQCCPNPKKCYSTSFRINEAANKFSHTKDYQEIKLQEQVQKLIMGTIPKSIWVTLEDDLADTVKPGDDIIVCGIVLQRWQPLVKGCRPSIDLVIKANNVTVRNKQRTTNYVTDELREEFSQFWRGHQFDPLCGRNKILASFCPQVHGLYVVKLAISVVLAGGVQNTDVSGTKTRGESHLLLVGDPGTGKSQFLKYVANLVPRCVLTTGIGTTSAGLTVAAVREEGEWALEAGALVLADGGVCCIDEFNSVKEVDRAAIHEAMEQQTVSVAKAGLVCKLNTRCTVLAATNPKGQYDPNESLTINVALASPLLSRFDVILVLLDTINPDWDRVVSEYILKGFNPLNVEMKNTSSSSWSIEYLQAYFSHVRTLQPKMTTSARTILSRYFQLQRQTDSRNQARTTVRLLESLVRLSQGHARFLMREEVTTMDAIIAITLMEASMCGSALITGVNPLHTAFPHCPRQEYKKQCQMVLEKLNLLNILNDEMVRLDEEWANETETTNIASEHLDSTQMSKTKNSLNTGSNVQSERIRKCLTQERGRIPLILELNEEEEKELKRNKTKVKSAKKKKKKRKAESDSEDGENDVSLLPGGLDLPTSVLVEEAISEASGRNKKSRSSETVCTGLKNAECDSGTATSLHESSNTSGKRCNETGNSKGPNILKPFITRENSSVTTRDGSVGTVTEINSGSCSQTVEKKKTKAVRGHDNIGEVSHRFRNVDESDNFDAALDKASQDILDFEDFEPDDKKLGLSKQHRNIRWSKFSLKSKIDEDTVSKNRTKATVAEPDLEFSNYSILQREADNVHNTKSLIKNYNSNDGNSITNDNSCENSRKEKQAYDGSVDLFREKSLDFANYKFTKGKHKKSFRYETDINYEKRSSILAKEIDESTLSITQKCEESLLDNSMSPDIFANKAGESNLISVSPLKRPARAKLSHNIVQESLPKSPTSRSLNASYIDKLKKFRFAVKTGECENDSRNNKNSNELTSSALPDNGDLFRDTNSTVPGTPNSDSSANHVIHDCINSLPVCNNISSLITPPNTESIDSDMSVLCTSEITTASDSSVSVTNKFRKSFKLNDRSVKKFQYESDEELDFNLDV